MVDLKLGPTYTDINNSTLTSHGNGGKHLTPCTTSLPCINSDTSVANGAIREYDTGQTGSFMADAVTIEGFRPKDASNTMNSRTVKLADGTRLFSGSAEDGAPKAKKE